MDSLTATEWAILDTTARQSTNLEQIYQRLHLPSDPVPLADAALAVQGLLAKGLLATDRTKETSVVGYADIPQSVLNARFSITESGRDFLTSMLDAQPRRSLFGIWKDRGIHLKREDADEVRREMWGNFPRDDPK